MTDPKAKAVKWLHHLYKGEFSELGKTVAWFLDEMWGLHHINRTSLKKVGWNNVPWIEVVFDRSMSTVDNDDLTRLVVIAHQMMLRVNLQGVGPGYVKLAFHQRTCRDTNNGIAKYCPGIHEHVNEIAKWHPSVEQLKMQQEIYAIQKSDEGS